MHKETPKEFMYYYYTQKPFFFFVHMHVIMFSFLHTILVRYYVKFGIDIIVFNLQVNWFTYWIILSKFYKWVELSLSRPAKMVCLGLVLWFMCRPILAMKT